MAIDTENKRRSASNWFCRIPPVPDGTIAGVDRQHVAGLYSGITAQSLLRLMKVFMIRDSGTPKLGLSPIIDIFVKVFDGTSAGSAPSVVELSGGYYKFHHDIAQDTVIRVDSQDVLMSDNDRYNDIGVITPYDDAIDIKLSDLENNIRGTDNDDLKDISDEIAALPTPSGIADAVWDEDLTTHPTSGTAGKIVSAIKKGVDAIISFVS